MEVVAMLGRLKKLWGREEARAEEAPPAGVPVEPTGGEAAEPVAGSGGDGAPEGVGAPAFVPVFEMVRFEEILFFRSNEEFPVLEPFERPLEMDDGSTETLVLRPRTRGKPVDGISDYTADVEASEAALKVLTDRYGPEFHARGGREERRATPRYLHCIRVRSRHLPRFQGLTHDVSAEGLRLIVEGEVQAGTPLELEMQLDHIRLPDVKARGEIVWAAERDNRTWWAGVKLTEVFGDTWPEYLAEVAGATSEGLTRHNFLDS